VCWADESPAAQNVLNSVNQQCEADAAEVEDDGFAACNDTIDVETFDTKASLPGTPVGWKVPEAPENWKAAKPKTKLGQPKVEFDELDNPGGWSPFAFRPKFLHKGQKPTKCLCHALPAETVPVPKDEAGDRACDGFKFFHAGWTKPTTCPTFWHGNARDKKCRK